MILKIALGLAALLLAAGWFLYQPDLPRGPLEAQYAPPPSTFIEVEGLRIHLRDTGPRTAPAIILLHGFGSSLHTWEGWAPILEPEHRMIRLDLPGFGLTGADPTGDYTDTRAVRILIALMDRLQLPRADIAGSSMGGRIAWRLAATHPDRVSHLILMAPDGFASPGRAYDQPPHTPWMLRLLPWTMPDFMLRPSISPAYAHPERIPETTFQRYRAMMLAPGVRTAILARAGQDQLTPPEPLLARITAPTLLLWGSDDHMIPPTHARDYLRALPDAHVLILPDTGHVPMEENPGESGGAVLEWLRG